LIAIPTSGRRRVMKFLDGISMPSVNASFRKKLLPNVSFAEARPALVEN
jgi:hypothetical protein